MRKTVAEQLSTEQQEIFFEAQRCSERGDLAGTLQALKKLVAANPNVGIVRAMLGNVYWETGDTKSAEFEFLEAVKLSPDSERVSLILFHFLFEQGKTDDAFEEIKRYTKLNESEEYRNIIRSLNEQ